MNLRRTIRHGYDEKGKVSKLEEEGIGASGQTKANFGRNLTSEESRWTVFLSPGLFRKVLFVCVKKKKNRRNLGICSGIRIDLEKKTGRYGINPVELTTLPSRS